MDAFLLLLLPIFTLIAACVSLQVLVYFQMPEDDGFKNGWVCKLFFILSLTLSGVVTMLLPIDVKNAAEDGGLNMKGVWPVAFILMMIFAFIINPVAMLFYETEGDLAIKASQRLRSMVIQGSIFTLVLISIIGITYLMFSKTLVWLIHRGQQGLEVLPSSQPAVSSMSALAAFHVYMMAALSFVGWFLFTVFGGSGLAAMPYKLIIAYVQRPRSAIRNVEYNNHRDILAKAAGRLQARAGELKNEEAGLEGYSEIDRQPATFSYSSGDFRRKRKEASLRLEFNKFKADVYMLEEAFRHAGGMMDQSKKENRQWLLVGRLALGIVCAIISFLWFLHIILFMLARKSGTNTPVAPMLNWFLTDFINNDSFFIITFLIFGILVLYLQAATITGCITFGTRLFFIVPVHFLHHRDTPLNSLLFNASLILLSTAATVHFSTLALANYAQQSEAWHTFGTEIHYLDFYRFFFKHKVFLYIMIISTIAGLIILGINTRLTKAASLYVDKEAEKRIRELAAAATDAK